MAVVAVIIFALVGATMAESYVHPTSPPTIVKVAGKLKK